jgi:hypothetical protein
MLASSSIKTKVCEYDELVNVLLDPALEEGSHQTNNIVNAERLTAELIGTINFVQTITNLTRSNAAQRFSHVEELQQCHVAFYNQNGMQYLVCLLCQGGLGSVNSFE